MAFLATECKEHSWKGFDIMDLLSRVRVVVLGLGLSLLAYMYTDVVLFFLFNNRRVHEKEICPM